MKGALSRVSGVFVCARCAGELNVHADAGEWMNEVERVSKFCYLGDMLYEDGRAGVDARIQCAWRKFREVSGVMCARWMSYRMKGVMLKRYVRPVLLHGAEAWAVSGGCCVRSGGCCECFAV